MSIAYKLDVLWCRTFQAVLKLGNYFMGYRMPKYMEGPGKIRELGAFLKEKGTADVTDGCALAALLRRPEIHYADLEPFDPNWPNLSADIAEQVEISVKYEGYIQRQQKQVEDFERMEQRLLPPELDFHAIQGLRLEARQKLNQIKPLNLGQASRISGVSPADIAALMVFLSR